MMTIKTEKKKNKLNVASAQKQLEKLGIQFNNIPRYKFTLTIKDDVAGVIIDTPMHFCINPTKLTEIAEKILSLGFCGKVLVESLVDAINELEQDEQDDLRNTCWVSSYTPTDMVKYFVDLVFINLEQNNIAVSRNNFSKGSARNMWWSLGGYRGLKAFFTDMAVRTIHEFRRIRHVEEKIDMAKVIPINNPDLDIDSAFQVMLMGPEAELRPVEKYAEFNPCLTCSRCKIDRYGDRKCKDYYIHIPEEYTVADVNRMYPTASVVGYDKLASRFIFHNVRTCQYRHERIGSKVRKDTKDTTTADNRHSVVVE